MICWIKICLRNICIRTWTDNEGYSDYHGSEGTKEFPTQKELMELVHKLNPDGVEAEPKIYRHPIPDDKFEELKKGCPEANLTEKPNIYFQYYPLDWLSGDENIQGVAIKLSFDSFFEALVPQAVNMSMGNKTLTQFYICLTGLAENNKIYRDIFHTVKAGEYVPIFLSVIFDYIHRYLMVSLFMRIKII